MISTASRSESVPADRLERLLAAVKARMPTRCPHCSTAGPVPAFIAGCDAWLCADWRCARIFEAVD